MSALSPNAPNHFLKNDWHPLLEPAIDFWSEFISEKTFFNLSAFVGEHMQ
jgi:hypothetical protein